MMAQSTRAMLIGVLASGYHSLRRRLAARLGSQDLASEALHETWLDMRDGRELGPVHNPDSYIYRAALHTAHRLQKADRRYLDAVEIGALFDLADEAPDPERIAAGKSEMRRLAKLLGGLSRRQRTIFVECYLRDGTYAELAERFGVSVRTVQSELREAMIEVARQMMDKDRFMKADLKVSRK